MLPIRISRFSWDDRLSAALLGVGISVTALIIGGLLAIIGPLYTTALLIALGAAVWAIADLDHALLSMIAVITLLPYATLPFKVVITPTFLDLAMVAALAIYLLEWMTGKRRRLATTPVHAFVILFMVLCVFSFVAGLRYAGLNTTVARRFAEMLLSIGFVLVLVDVLDSFDKLKRFALMFLVGGTAAAGLAIVFWLLPDLTAEAILRRMAVIGYPEADVIRYIEQNPELPERAIGTSVNPNALGGLLVVIAALAAPQLVSDAPLTGKRWHFIPVMLVLTTALILTFSRGSMLAFGAALMVIAALRYPRLLLIPALLAGLLLILPWTQVYVDRFLEGFQGADLATQMRFGEYRDAVTLISRYPLFGVGFTGTPDIDIYLGVASVYLAMAGNMGLLGLGAFFLLIAGLFAYAWQARKQIKTLPGHEAVWLGLVAAVCGALVNGIFDHYFFNLDFHPAVATFWLYIGMLLAITRITLAETPHGPASGAK